MESKPDDKDFSPVFATLLVFVPVLAFIMLGTGTALDVW